MKLPKLLKSILILVVIFYVSIFSLYVKYSFPLGMSFVDTFTSFHRNLFIYHISFIKTIVPGTQENLASVEAIRNPTLTVDSFSEIDESGLDVKHPISYFNEFLERSKTEYSASYNWNWEDSLVFGTFLSADRDKQLIGLQIISPKDYGVIVENAKLAFNVSCEPAQTFLIDGDLNVLDTEKNVYDLIQEGDSLLSLCTGEACGTLGKACIIWRNGGL